MPINRLVFFPLLSVLLLPLAACIGGNIALRRNFTCWSRSVASSSKARPEPSKSRLLSCRRFAFRTMWTAPDRDRHRQKRLSTERTQSLGRVAGSQYRPRIGPKSYDSGAGGGVFLQHFNYGGTGQFQGIRQYSRISCRPARTGRFDCAMANNPLTTEQR